MNTQNRSNQEEGFQVEDPQTVFEKYSSEEIQRLRETDPDFNESLHQEAVSLVLNRLKTYPAAT